MSKIVELNSHDVTMVAGGNILRDLEERFPNGEWRNGSFWPNGYPKEPWTGPTTW